MLNISFWNIAFTIINVLVLLLFMRHFLMKPVMEILEQRKQMVEKDLDAASTAKSQAEALKTQYAASQLSNKIPKIEITNKAYKNQRPPFGLFLPIKTSTARVE